MNQFSFSWRDAAGNLLHTVYEVNIGDPWSPIVVLLHGANGHASDFLTGRSDAFPYDYNSPLPSTTRDLGWHSYPGVGAWSLELDPALPDIQYWIPFLLANGCSTVSYDQIDAGGLAARPVLEFAALLRDLFNVALPSVGLGGNPLISILTHSRGAVIARKALKDNAQDPILQGRIDKVMTLCGPNQGSEILNAVYAPIQALNAAADSYGSLGAPIRSIVNNLLQQAGGGYWQEVYVGSPFLTDLANNELPFPGATYFTFGGTNVTYTRIRGWWFTGDSAVPHWNVPPFHWQAYAAEAPGISPVLDSLPHPSDELTPGKGDIFVADSRAHLPFSIQVTHPISHPQYLYDNGAHAEVLAILFGEFSNRSTLAAGECLRTNEFLLSANGSFKAIVQGDGNFVIYHGGNPVWASNTWGQGSGTYFVTLQADGNLVLFDGTPDRPGAQLWSSNMSQSRSAFFVRLENSGNLRIYRGNPIWATNTNMVAPPPSANRFRTSTIASGEFLGKNQSLISGDGVFKLILQTDGNLVIYRADVAIWASNTNMNFPACFATMQVDGNFVIYDGSPKNQRNLLWASGTNIGAGAYFLTIQTDGNLVVYTGLSIWGT